jgi:hypothetical protein
VALKTVPALVVDIADAVAVAASPATRLGSGTGFGLVFTSVTEFISVFPFFFLKLCLAWAVCVQKLTSRLSLELWHGANEQAVLFCSQTHET